MIRPIVTLALASLIVQATVIAANAQIAFTYHAPGDLVAGSGRNDRTIYFPDIMFPLAVGPSAGNVQAFAHSQIHPPADRNAYPWRDTYCEPREWSMSLCPTEKGHQGDDISPFTNENVKWSAVARMTASLPKLAHSRWLRSVQRAIFIADTCTSTPEVLPLRGSGRGRRLGEARWSARFPT